LWDIDVLVNRTVVYSILIATLGFVFIVTTYVSERMVESLLGEKSFVTSLGSAVLVAYLVDPVKKRTEHFVDRRFYRDSAEIRAAFAELTHEVRGMNDSSSLPQVLAGGIESILQVALSDVYLRQVDGSFARASQGHAAPVQEPVVPPDPATLDRLENGRVVLLAKNYSYALLVPITLPAFSGKGQAPRLVGILALGPRLSGQGYSREEIAMLLTLADQACTSLPSARPFQPPSA
jgi:GAF domain-containing protein